MPAVLADLGFLLGAQVEVSQEIPGAGFTTYTVTAPGYATMLRIAADGSGFDATEQDMLDVLADQDAYADRELVFAAATADEARTILIGLGYYIRRPGAWQAIFDILDPTVAGEAGKGSGTPPGGYTTVLSGLDPTGLIDAAGTLGPAS